MKKIIFILSITIVLLACTSTDKKSGDANSNSDSTQQAEKAKIMSDTANYTNIQWLDSTFLSMGTVNEGAQVEVSFRFKNIGNKPLVIVIKAKFDSKGRVGEQRKHISVDANTTPSRAHDLEFTVDVKK